MTRHAGRFLFWVGVVAIGLGVAIIAAVVLACDQCELDALLYLFYAVVCLAGGACMIALALVRGPLRKGERWVALIVCALAVAGGLYLIVTFVRDAFFPEPGLMASSHSPWTDRTLWIGLVTGSLPLALGGAGLWAHWRRVRTRPSPAFPPSP